MKEQTNLDVVIIRPGLIYSQYERSWAMPLAALSTVGSFMCEKQPPSTSLERLTSLILTQIQTTKDKRVIKVINAKDF